MSTNQRETKEWLAAIAKHLGLSPSQLALNSGMAASTLTRYLNDTSGTVGISQATLDKVADYSGFRPHQFPGIARSGFAEMDTIPFANDNEKRAEWIEAAVKQAKGGSNGVNAWVMKGAALDGIGIMPNDILIIDQNRRPKAGDVVLAQIIDHLRGTAETVMRLYQPPFITSLSIRLGPQRPDQVDEDRVTIVGTSVGIIRPL